MPFADLSNQPLPLILGLLLLSPPCVSGELVGFLILGLLLFAFFLWRIQRHYLNLGLMLLLLLLQSLRLVLKGGTLLSLQPAAQSVP